MALEEYYHWAHFLCMSHRKCALLCQVTVTDVCEVCTEKKTLPGIFETVLKYPVKYITKEAFLVQTISVYFQVTDLVRESVDGAL